MDCDSKQTIGAGKKVNFLFANIEPIAFPHVNYTSRVDVAMKQGTGD
jgi:hypothetical protein